MKTHKSLTLVFSTIILSFTIASCQIQSYGEVVEQEREVSEFTSIQTSNGLDLYLRQGNDYSLRLVADEDIIDDIKTEVQGETLKVYIENKSGSRKKREVHITFRELNSITASGGSDVNAKTIIEANNFEVNLSGGSDLDNLILSAHKFTGDFSGGSDAKIDFEKIEIVKIFASGGSDIEIDNLIGEVGDIQLRGGSDAELSGELKGLKIHASGGSDVEAYNLSVEDCTIELSGASDGVIAVTGSIDITLSGGSDLSVRGKPEIVRKEVCKSCDLELY